MEIIKKYKLKMTAILIVIFILLSWKTTYFLGCFSLLIPLIYCFVIASSFIEIRIKEKECYKNCYFKDKTLLASMITSPYFTSLIYIILSIFYTFSFMYNTLNYGIIFYGIIIFFIVFTNYLYKSLLHFFSKIINEKHTDIFTREISIKITAILLFILYSAYFMYGYEPNYLRETIEATILEATKSIGSSCILIDYIIRVYVEIDATVLFVTKVASINTDNSNINNLIWLAFIVMNTLSILGLNRFIMQIIYFLNKYERKI